MSNKRNTPDTAQRDTPGAGFELRLTEDYMAILLTCTVPARQPESLTARIRNELAALGLESEAHMDEAVARYEKAVPSGPHLRDVVLLEGVPPEPPVDESITWNGDFHAKGFVIDPETGRADYRRKAADVSVEENQLLAEVIPGQPGQNGQDVFGRVVAPREPRRAEIRAGRHVLFNEAERCYYAETSGRFRYVDGVVFVDDVFRVPGDVGLRTGNINHPGALVVARDILSGAEAIASGDIDVGENIEDAVVRSGGNLTVQGGVSCKERGVLQVAGNLHARFLRNAEVEVAGDVFIDREITQCRIRTRGAVIVKSGRIVGGSIVALKGIETGDLGSEACIPADLATGKDYTMEAALAEKRGAVESSRTLLLKLREAVAPYKAKQHALTPAMKHRLAGMLEELQKREAEFAAREKALDDMITATHAAANYQIFVHGKIYPDNRVQVGAQIKKIKEPVEGPLRIGLKNGKLTFFRLKDDDRLQNTL